MTGKSYSTPICLSRPAAIELSAGVAEEACTRTSTSFGVGVGAGRSSRSAGRLRTRPWSRLALADVLSGLAHCGSPRRPVDFGARVVVDTARSYMYINYCLGYSIRRGLPSDNERSRHRPWAPRRARNQRGAAAGAPGPARDAAIAGGSHGAQAVATAVPPTRTPARSRPDDPARARRFHERRPEHPRHAAQPARG